MAKRKDPKEGMSMWERTQYKVVREWEDVRNGTPCHCAELRLVHGGGTAICYIPHHTPEEEAEIAANFVEAAFRMLEPDTDFSGKRLILKTDGA